jgi:hypothetical protein
MSDGAPLTASEEEYGFGSHVFDSVSAREKGFDIGRPSREMYKYEVVGEDEGSSYRGTKYLTFMNSPHIAARNGIHSIQFRDIDMWSLQVRVIYTSGWLPTAASMAALSTHRPSPGESSYRIAARLVLKRDPNAQDHTDIDYRLTRINEFPRIANLPNARFFTGVKKPTHHVTQITDEESPVEWTLNHQGLIMFASKYTYDHFEDKEQLMGFMHTLLEASKQGTFT